MTTYYYTLPPVGSRSPIMGHPTQIGCGEGFPYDSRMQQLQAIGQSLSSSMLSMPRRGRSLQVVNCNGYSIQVTPGQRKYGGPPPDWIGEPPGEECEIYCGKIPRTLMENELIPLFERYGRIWEFRLMISSTTQRNRGFGFIRYTTHESAMDAIANLNDKPIPIDGVRSTRQLKVESCVKKVSLYVANIPKAKSKDELLAEFARRTKGLVEVIVYLPPEEKVKKNRGFCFLEYDTHFNAFLAKKHLSTTETKFWGCEIIVDWADPMKEPEAEVMSKVKILFVRNLSSRVNEERLRAIFSTFGLIERVKRIKHYAFVHFRHRVDAEKALAELNGQEFCGTNLEIVWSKPPDDKRQKEEILRARERRMADTREGGHYSDFRNQRGGGGGSRQQFQVPVMECPSYSILDDSGYADGLDYQLVPDASSYPVDYEAEFYYPQEDPSLYENPYNNYQPEYIQDGGFGYCVNNNENVTVGRRRRNNRRRNNNITRRPNLRNIIEADQDWRMDSLHSGSSPSFNDSTTATVNHQHIVENAHGEPQFFSTPTPPYPGNNTNSNIINDNDHHSALPGH